MQQAWQQAPVVGGAAPAPAWAQAPAIDAPAPARPTAPRRQAAPAPAPMRPQAPAAPAPVLNDLGITDAEERDALIYQGYSPEQADREMEYRRAGNGDAAMFSPEETAANVQMQGAQDHAQDRYDNRAAIDPTLLVRSPWLTGQPTYMPREATGQYEQDGQSAPITAYPALRTVDGRTQAFDEASHAYYDVTPEQVATIQGRLSAEQKERISRAEGGGIYLARADEARKDRLLEDAGSGRELDITDQFTAPLNDELGWAAGYGMQATDNLIRRLTGRDVEIGAIDRARAVRDISLEDQTQFERDRPAEALAGGLLGGFAFAPAKGAQVPGLLGRLGQAGGVGAAYGAAEGDGVLGRVQSGAASGALSVATAGALESLAPAAGGVIGAVERARAPAGAFPSGQDRRVGGAIERALQRDGMTPQEFGAALPARAEGRLPFEAGGENLVGLAETMAQAPGQARASLLRAVGERRDNASNRVSTRLADSFGAQGNGFQAIRQRIAARSAEAEAGMAPIANVVVPLDDASVLAFRSRLSSRAVRDAAEEAIADMSPEGSAAANRLFGLGDQVLDNPGAAQITVREAQDISYALKEAASRAYRGGFNSRGEALQTLSTSIRQNARDRVGGYDDWLKSFGDASEAIGAMRTGQNVFARANERNAMSAAELADQWSGWSAAARENYRLGVGEAVLDRVRGNGGVPAMRRLLRDNELADRVRIAFDSEDAFLRFMRSADDEVSMANVDQQVLGGSPTARRLAGAADVNEQSFGPMDALDFATDLTSPVAFGRRAVKEVAGRLPKRDRSILGDEELNGLLGRALTDEAEMTRLLNLMQARPDLSASISQRLRGLGLLSAPGAVAGGQERARGLLTATP